jgi:hypothetical protein
MRLESNEGDPRFGGTRRAGSSIQEPGVSDVPTRGEEGVTVADVERRCELAPYRSGTYRRCRGRWKEDDDPHGTARTAITRPLEASEVCSARGKGS